MSDVLEKPDTVVTTEEGDHDRFSHYARKSDIEKSMFEGVEIVALCGKKWRPSGDFAKFPICPTCQEARDALPG